jgi:signal transduction histidine kinase/ActR/RegA family two-component response regulator
MHSSEHAPADDRVLLLTPTGHVARLAQKTLTEVGMSAALCATMAELCRQVQAGVGAILLAEEALEGGAMAQLVAIVKKQPSWSDIPLVLMTNGNANTPAEMANLRTLEALRNVTFLERPIRVMTLVSTLRAALRARARQYEVRDHLAQRQRSEAALRQDDRRKDDFLATLGHELRNPLAAIRHAVEVLQMPGVDQADLQHALGVVRRQVGQLSRLVDDLLDVSRITRGKTRLSKERVDLAGILARAAETVQPLMKERGHVLTVSLPSEPLWLDADPSRLEQVLANLLTNAAKYTDPGGQVWLEGARRANHAEARVRDTGIGIRPEVLPHVFDLFVQADPALNRAEGGMGIGLTLVRRLVELHGGRVWANSPGAGRGSEFVVRLPLVLTEPAVMDEPAERAAVSRPRRVLIVDDNVDAAETLGVLLRRRGHDVEVVHDGAAGLLRARQRHPEVVLLDIGLPGGMDGYEVARRLRQEPGMQQALLVAVTGFGQEEDRRQAQASGFDCHLVKPAEPEELQRILAMDNPNAETDRP